MERPNPYIVPSTISVLAARAAIAASGAALALLFSLHVLSPEFSPACIGRSTGARPYHRPPPCGRARAINDPGHRALDWPRRDRH